MNLHLVFPYSSSSSSSLLFSFIDPMALQSGDKPMLIGYDIWSKPKSSWTLLGLRLLAFLATTAATLVMVLNKQTKTFVVTTIGTTPVNLSLTAKFQHTPAFV